VLSLPAIAARLGVGPASASAADAGRPLQFLTGGARDLPARQQTLRDAINWSYGLLHADEQTMFRRLCVFSGGCTLDAVERVAAEPTEEGRSPFDLVEALVDNSLLRQDAPDRADADEPRFTMLETIRAFGQELLEASGEQQAVRRRHAAYVVALAEEAEPELRGPHQGVWLADLEREHDNCRAALIWAMAGQDATLALRLAGALGRFWYLRGHYSEGRSWLERALGLAADRGVTDHVVGGAIFARALTAAAVLAEGQGDHQRATELAQRSLALWESAGDRAGGAGALNVLGNAARRRGDLTAAWAYHEQSLRERRAGGDHWTAAGSLNNLAVVARRRGDLADAAALCREGLTIRRALGDQGGEATSLNTLATLLQEQGDVEQAATLFGRSLDLWRALGERWGMAGATRNLAALALDEGALTQAAALYRQGWTLSRDLGDADSAAECLTGLARVAAAHGQPERALRLFGTASAHAGRAAPSGLAQQIIAEARASLDDEAARRLWAAGEALSPAAVDVEVDDL